MEIEPGQGSGDSRKIYDPPAAVVRGANDELLGFSTCAILYYT